MTVTDSKIKKFNKEPDHLHPRTRPEAWPALDVDSLQLCYLNEKSSSGCRSRAVLSTETNTLTASINHFSYYGEVANPTILGPGKIMAYQVNLHSGAATSQYPIDVPAGSGGFPSPPSASSTTAPPWTRSKNKKSMGSWVGIG